MMAIIGMKHRKNKTQSPSLYNLYDNNKVLLSDSSIYSSSDFVGSKIFGYKEGTGTNDTELDFIYSQVLIVVIFNIVIS